jgi:hypothetical protein
MTAIIGALVVASAATQPRLHKSSPSSPPVSMAGIGAIIYDNDLRGDAETPVEIREDLKPARGLILGLLFSVAMWSGIGSLIWFLL